VGELLGVGRLGTDARHAGDVPAGPVRLNGPGGCLPPFDLGDAFREKAKQCRDVFGSAVAGGLAEAILVAPYCAVELRPSGDLVLMADNPFVTAALRCGEHRQVFECGVGVSPGGPGVLCPPGGGGELVGDIRRSMISEPSAEGGVLAVGGIEAIG
jgi:hypothetical protein